MSELEEVYNYIDGHLAKHTARIQEYIRQPGISNSGEGIPECAELTKRYFEELGAEARVVDVGVTKWPIPDPLEGHPVVYGEYDAGAEKTLIIYMLYDTMPAYESEKWRAPPFEGRLVEQPPFKKVIIGRGAVNSRGPCMAILNALESIKAVAGELPVNLKLIAEGDEERLSIGLDKFVHDHQDELKEADALFGCVGVLQMANGVAVPVAGSEGCLYIELETRGEWWGRGPTEFGIHGARKRVVDSPVWRHIKMLSALVSEDGNKIMVKGWYDDIEEPTERDLELLDASAKYADPETVKKMYKIKYFIDEPPTWTKREFMIRTLYNMTFNIDGIWAGLTEPGFAGTVVPCKITSKHNCRYMPNVKGEDLVKKIRAHLNERGYKDVRIKVIGNHDPYKPNYETDIARALFKMYERFGVEYVKLPAFGTIGLGPSWPAYLFGEMLQIPIAMGALGHGGRYHAVDEFFVIERGAGKVYGLAGCEKGVATTLYNYAGKT